MPQPTLLSSSNGLAVASLKGSSRKMTRFEGGIDGIMKKNHDEVVKMGKMLAECWGTNLGSPSQMSDAMIMQLHCIRQSILTGFSQQGSASVRFFSVIFDMAERKVLNKYFPPDFDPSKLPRLHRSKNQQMKVRMMIPVNIRCTYCGNYINKGTKLNSRKEGVICETYLGIQIFRFYFKCTKCSGEMTIKTDPKNSDYIVESGATRNFEPWRAEDEEEREERGCEDAMKSLEKRSLDGKREMEILAALDEIKDVKSTSSVVIVKKPAKEEKKKKKNTSTALLSLSNYESHADSD
ncbi:hypothetical protein V6N12_050906 [Hibiscus sabdariffa]|uniref:Splicing factor YJU2 n=1 Tax=Hibiscus sabdariffa TaxID=183260 RepID=A0ABR2GEK8_9ROSI